MAFCNCQRASYEYEFIIVQLQADCIIFIGFFFSFFFLPLAWANYRISILRQSSDKGEAFSVCCHYIILSNVKHPSGRAAFVTKLCVEVHLPNWVVMSCQERGLGDWLSAGRPEPVGRMGWPATSGGSASAAAPQAWGGGAWRTGAERPSDAGCEIYLGCLRLFLLLIWFHCSLSEAEEDFRGLA